LVTGKPEAKMILEAIQTAKKPLKVFRKMAKKYSNCPSGSKGGDLGEFIEGQMVQDFEEAVWASELETVPESFIKTQFGFHILWVHSKGQLE
jgi:peptidyl-prolyl cis-trans isomerase C